MAMVRPDCSVDAPPVVILALALVSAPPPPAARAGMGSVSMVTIAAVAMPEATVLARVFQESLLVDDAEVDCFVCMENPSVSSTNRHPITAAKLVARNFILGRGNVVALGVRILDCGTGAGGDCCVGVLMSLLLSLKGSKTVQWLWELKVVSSVMVIGSS